MKAIIFIFMLTATISTYSQDKEIEVWDTYNKKHVTVSVSEDNSVELITRQNNQNIVQNNRLRVLTEEDERNIELLNRRKDSIRKQDGN